MITVDESLAPKKGKLVLPEALIERMNKIEYCMQRDLDAPKKERRRYVPYIKKDENGKKTEPHESLELAFDEFKRFKKSLMNGSNRLMRYIGEEDEENKLEIIARIKFFTEILEYDHSRCYVENQVFVDPELEKTLDEMSKSIENDVAKEANRLIDFLKKAYWCSITEEDSFFKVKKFILVKSQEEFEEGINHQCAEEYTSLFSLKHFRFGFFGVDSETIMRSRGIYEDYARFAEKYGKFDHNFEIWHNVDNEASFLIYVC